MPDAVVMFLRDLAVDAARLVVPVACAGCGLEDIRLCESCSAPWWEAPFRAEEGAGRLDVLGRSRLPVWAVAELDGNPHRSIGTWKEGGRRDLDAFFAQAAARAARAIAPALASVGPLCVVPVPSKSASVRRRGADLSALLAASVAKELASPMRRLLRATGTRSRGRSSVGRWESAGVAVRGRAPLAATVLVDDVLTTGATLARASDALEAASLPVVCGIVLAATPRRDVS